MISEFPVFTGKIEHAHTVYTRPSLSQREGPGDEAIPYHTAKFNSNNGVKNVVLGQTAKFNDRQYFRLYGIHICPIFN